MRKIATLDAETDPFKFGRIPAPFIWGVYDGEYYYEFDDDYELIEFLEDKPWIVYAHNGGKFDYHFLLDHFIPYDSIKIISGRIAKFKIGLCEFRDSYNIVPVPLSAYQKTEIDYGIMESEARDIPENRQAISAYLKDDCVFLYDLVTEFINRYGCHLTLATASMKTWQKMSGQKPPQSNLDYYNAFKQFYYGGRVQCFKTGVINEPFKVADINSAYPTAMLDEHPIGTDYEILSGDDIDDFLRTVIIGNWFYLVRARTAGAFPFRKDDSSLDFPLNHDGVFAVTGWELKAAIDTNTASKIDILEIRRHFEFGNFEDYIMHFYEKRKVAKAEGDVAETLFCKLLMNSLYGKFGANPEKYSNFMLIPPQSVPDSEKLRGREIAVLDEFAFSGMMGPWCLGSQPLDESEQRFYNIATAASITGWVRAFLWRAICKSRGVIYCDTDSIFAKDFDLDFGPELGQWEIEGEFEGGAFAGKKLYACRDGDDFKMATKGVRLTPEQVYKVALGETVTYQPEAPTFSIHSAPRFVQRDIRMTS